MFLIALTGYGQASDRAAGREAGFDEHLVKPVNIEGLLSLLADLRSGPSRGDPATEGDASGMETTT